LFDKTVGSVGDAVGAAVGGLVGLALGAAVGAALGAAVVGAAVGAALGAAVVGAAVGGGTHWVKMGVGTIVGKGVGADVGTVVGAAVGADVRTGVGALVGVVVAVYPVTTNLPHACPHRLASKQAVPTMASNNTMGETLLQLWVPWYIWILTPVCPVPLR